ncbi:hypothetical protein MKW92_041356 [Papaver armeniacum]|nr:hypothetical protein MKW92_041356 [Papaver armeniacum]
MVWSCYDHNKDSFYWQHHVFDAIAMEDNNSICVVNWCDDLGFMDLRSTKGSIRWNWENHRRHKYIEPLDLTGF